MNIRKMKINRALVILKNVAVLIIGEIFHYYMVLIILRISDLLTKIESTELYGGKNLVDIIFARAGFFINWENEKT